MISKILKFSVLAILGASLFGCAARHPAYESYTVRGLIAEDLGKEGNLRHWVIVHEKIADFKNVQGQMTGMEPMPMNFAMFKKVSADEFHVGEKVLLTFEVRWDQPPHLFITHIEKMDEATPLDLGGFYLEK